MSSWYALEVRKGNEYLTERFRRLFVPLIFGLLIIVPPQGVIARLKSGNAIDFGQFINSFFTDFSNLSGYLEPSPRLTYGSSFTICFVFKRPQRR